MLSKKTKYGIALTFGTPKDQTPVAIKLIQVWKYLTQNFREFYCCCAIPVFGSQKRKRRWLLLDKSATRDNNMAHVYRIWGPNCITSLCSHNFEPCIDCTDEATCAVRKLMTEVRDNTLMILENNTLADIALDNLSQKINFVVTLNSLLFAY
jgi:hypothetical protein